MAWGLSETLRTELSALLVKPESLYKDLSLFHTIIDVRSPAEYELDHIPGAINCPVLSNEERAHIGTIYKQESPFAAKKIGAALVAKNIATHLQEHFLNKERDWTPLVYCWRGGERSGAFTHILQRIGWKAYQLKGGYQDYRRQVIIDLEEWASKLQFKVICGMTGSGKTRLLKQLKERAQVLDLEELAAHRGSVLGGLPNQEQPSQKAFETALWNAVRGFDHQHIIFVESESKKVGGLHIPDALMEQIRNSECIEIQAERKVRVDCLMEDYAHFLEDSQSLEKLLTLLTQRYGKVQITKWQALSQEKNFRTLVDELLLNHYDPAYSDSIQRNFPNYAKAQKLVLQSASSAAYRELADQLLDLN